MSDHAKPDAHAAEGHEKPAAGGSIIPWIAVGVISAGIGSAMPLMMASQSHAPASEEGEEGADHGEEAASHDTTTESKGTSHGTTASKEKKARKVKAFTLPKEEETIFLPFADGDKDGFKVRVVVQQVAAVARLRVGPAQLADGHRDR